jgi:WD40 repeat protein
MPSDEPEANRMVMSQSVLINRGFTFAVAFAPRSELVACSGVRQPGGPYVEILDLKHNRCQMRLPIGGEDTVHSLCFSPDGEFLACSVFHDRLRVWDTGTWKEVKLVSEAERGQNSVAFSQDGLYISGSDADARVVLWTRPEGRAVSLGSHRYTLNDLDFSQDGEWLVTCDFRGTFKVWSLTENNEHWSFYAHEHPATRAVGSSACKFLADNRTIVTVGVDGYLRFWDTQRKKETNEPIPAGVSSIKTVAISPDRRLLAVGSAVSLSPITPGSLTIWDIVNRRRVLPLHKFQTGVSCCCFTPDGKKLLVGTSGPQGRLTLLDLPQQPKR